MTRLFLALLLVLIGCALAPSAAAQASRLQETWRWTRFDEDCELPWADVLHVTESGITSR